MCETTTYVDLSPPADNVRRRRVLVWLLLITILLIAAVLRFVGLGAESFWYDETLTWQSATAPTPQIIAAVRQHENAPPFYFILINLWAKVFGASDVALRWPSALIGVATVALFFCLGQELFNQTIGLTAAALLAVSPIHIAYSQEARMYALWVLLMVLCVWAFVRLVRGGSQLAQASYVATAALSLYTQTFAIFTILGLNLYFLYLLVRKLPTGVNLRRWIVLQLAVAVLFGPWVPATMEVARMGLPWMRQPTSFAFAMQGYAGGFWAAIVMCAATIAGLAWSRRRAPFEIALLILLAIVPVLGPVLYGTFTTRYGLPAMIGLSLLIAWSTASIGRWACVAIVLAASASWAATSSTGHPRYPGYTPKRDMRSVAAYVAQHAQPGDAVDLRLMRPIWQAYEHYARSNPLARVDSLETTQVEHIWLPVAALKDAQADAGFARFEIVSRHDFDGVILLELRLRNTPSRSLSFSRASIYTSANDDGHDRNR